MPRDPMSREEFVGLARSSGLAVIATVDPDGRPEAALVDIAVTDDGEVVFDTKTTARKMVNLAAEPRIAVVVGLSAGVSVQVEGTAQVLTGEERERYAAIHRAQLGKPTVDRDDFSLVRVVPTWLRCHDTRPASAGIAEWTWA